VIEPATTIASLTPSDAYDVMRPKHPTQYLLCDERSISLNGAKIFTDESSMATKGTKGNETAEPQRPQRKTLT
jgi:hypothetical protein